MTGWRVGAIEFGLTAPILKLPGPSVGDNYASTPDTASLSPTTLDVAVRLRHATWTPTVIDTIGSKWDGGLTNSWLFRLTNAGKLNLALGTSGGGRNDTSTTAVPFAANAWGWVRATYDPATGEITFQTSPDGATPSWTTLSTHAGTGGDMTDSTLAVSLGSWPGSQAYTGEMHQAVIRSTIGGAVIASPDFTTGTIGGTSVTDAQGNVWTLGGVASLAAPA